mmetsp:Transcript_22107/g.41935  ORF Transcript_22107/g.41935 Transcript_22107/m.41935 type:complete len:103 (+) Transcript_22107:464-772(+)
MACLLQRPSKPLPRGPSAVNSMSSAWVSSPAGSAINFNMDWTKRESYEMSHNILDRRRQSKKSNKNVMTVFHPTDGIQSWPRLRLICVNSPVKPFDLSPRLA